MTDRCDCGSKVSEPHLPACHYTGIVTAISRYNVADMMGNLIPDKVVEGKIFHLEGTEIPFERVDEAELSANHKALREAFEGVTVNPSYSQLRQALLDITAICDKGSYLGDLFEINRIIQKALARRPYSHE
jgi:hypothetical protein